MEKYKVTIIFKNGGTLEETFIEYDKACIAVENAFKKYKNVLRSGVKEIKK